jgi:hypothetical protein
VSRISSEIGKILKQSTYTEYDDLSGLVIDYTDSEQLLFLHDEMRNILERLEDVKYRIDYLNKPIKEVGTLYKNEEGRYGLEIRHSSRAAVSLRR